MSAIILLITIKHKYFRIMEYDNEDDTTSNLVIELEEATEMVDEIPNPVESINTDEVISDTLLKCPHQEFLHLGQAFHTSMWNRQFF